MNQEIENIIKKNLPEKKEKVYRSDGKTELFITSNFHFNQALSQINTSLIADEVLKKFIDYLELNPNEDGSTSPNIQHWIEKKQSQLRKLLSIVSPNKENENNE